MTLPHRWDTNLLHQARSGDAEARGRLLDRFRGYLTILARVQVGRRLQGKVDPADLVQDTFLKAHLAFGQLRGDNETAVAAWLRQILAGEIAHLVRRYWSQARNVGLEKALVEELNSSADRMTVALAVVEPSASDQASHREQTLVIADALALLAADYREVIILRQIEELPFVEVARRMGRSEDSIQKLWVRGLAALRRILEDDA